jgi:hypothetical protein
MRKELIKMKCALELITEKAIIEKIRGTEEEIRRAKKYEEIKRETIQFCEKIVAPALEECARNGKAIKYCFKTCKETTDRISGEDTVRPLVEESRTYVDGTVSQRIEWETEYSLKILTEYLKQFCYEVSISSIHYDFYGWGRNLSGLRVTIFAPDLPPCLE